LWLLVPVKIASNQRLCAGKVVSWFDVVFWHWHSRPPLNGSVSRFLIGCNMRNLIKKITFLVCGMLIIIGVLILNFYISFGYGSINGFLAEHRNLPKEDKLELLRNDAIKQLTQAHAELGSLTGLTLYEKTYSDLCSKGTHGWKREDPYAYVCSYRLTYYYGTNREYKELLLDVEKSLDDLGWTIQNRSPKQPTISESIDQYSGEIFLVELPVYVKKVSGDSVRLTINGFDGYGGYWTKSSEEPTPLGFGTALYQDIYKNESNKSPEEIFNEITSSGQDAIMIAISRQYFRN
jgi:hypothetical protein